MATLGPPDLNQLLAQMLQQQKEQRFSYLGQQETGPQKFGAALGMILGDAFRGSPEEQIKKGDTYRVAEQQAQMFRGVDPTDPQSLLAAAEKVQDSNPSLAWQFRDAAVQAEMLLFARQQAEADASRAQTEAGVAADTAKPRVTAAIAGATSAQNEADFSTQTLKERVRAVGLANNLNQAQLDRLESDVLDPSSMTHLGKLQRDRGALERQLARFDEGTAEYADVSRRLSETDTMIQNHIRNTTTTVNGTDLREATVRDIQASLRQYDALLSNIGELKTIIGKSGAQTGLPANVRRRVAGPVASITTELFGDEAGRAVSEQIVSTDTLTARSLSQIIIDQYTKVLHEGGDRFTKEARAAAKELINTLNTSADDRSALEVLDQITQIMSANRREDLYRLYEQSIVPNEKRGGAPMRVSEDTELTGAN